MPRIAILIDGGHLRVLTKKSGRRYDPDFIERFALACSLQDEEIFRVLYYDCAPYTGTVKLPVSGTDFTFTSPGGWLDELSRKTSLQFDAESLSSEASNQKRYRFLCRR